MIAVESYYDEGGVCWCVLGHYYGEAPELLAVAQTERGAWEHAQQVALAAGCPAYRRRRDGALVSAVAAEVSE